MWEYVDDGFHVQFSLFIMLVVIVSRLITVLALCSICNCFFKEFHMPLSEQLGFTLGENSSSLNLFILFYPRLFWAPFVNMFDILTDVTHTF